MEFGPVPTREAEGAILAHAIRTTAGRLPKGRRLTKDDLAAIGAAGFDSIAVARLGPDDLDENAAAARIADALAAGLTSGSLRAGPAANGRCNLYTRHAGLAQVDAAGVSTANLIDEGLTLATLPAFSPVLAGQLVATIKIITFGAPEAKVEQVAAAARGTVSVVGFRRQTAALIQTRLPHTTDALLAKTERSTRERLGRIEATIVQTYVTEHREDDLAAALAEAKASAGLIAVIGASAIVDRRDVVPAAIVAAGGAIEHFGLPVDPGNLTLLARLGEATVVAMPGSARSPREQGSDWLLERLAAGLPVDPATIAGFGVGGLLKEIRARPMLRDRAAAALKPQPIVDAILLAAGQSKRMGSRNKLLEPVGGEPLIRRVAAAVGAAGIRRLIVVTGHQADRVRDALSGLEYRFADNPDYPTGMGSSVAAGARAVFDAADPPDAAIVCLGDMPDITPAMLDALIANYDPAAGRTIVAATGGGQRGHPVLWDRRFAEDLASLSGDAGARDILREHAGQTVTVEMDNIAVLRDLDTPAAFDAYREGLGGAGDDAD